jgi:hypothetical protein
MQSLGDVKKETKKMKWGKEAGGMRETSSANKISAN